MKIDVVDPNTVSEVLLIMIPSDISGQTIIDYSALPRERFILVSGTTQNGSWSIQAPAQNAGTFYYGIVAVGALRNGSFPEDLDTSNIHTYRSVVIQPQTTNGGDDELPWIWIIGGVAGAGVASGAGIWIYRGRQAKLDNERKEEIKRRKKERNKAKEK